MHTQHTPRLSSGPFVYTGAGEPIAGAPPIDWPAMLTARPICRIVHAESATAEHVSRIVVLPVEDEPIPAEIRSDLTAAMAAGGAVAIHAPSNAAADAATRAIKTAPPRWLA